MTADSPAPANSRAAGGCVLTIGLAAAGGVAYAVPETAYFVTGLLAAAGYRRARAWAAARRANGEASGDEAAAVDIVEALQSLAVGGAHVRLTQLQEAAGLPDTKVVRALLDEAGVPVRPGVRAGGKNGPGVHHDDVPPLSAVGSDPPSGGCLCSSGANANANNGPSKGAGEGLRVEPIGQSGSVIRVPGERRAYTV
ncbi:hypothetical protein GTW69_38605 [Streptomyces sp. SID7760]|nr:hypothetical protein [Streptomyces sp. SID7760]